MKFIFSLIIVVMLCTPSLATEYWVDFDNVNAANDTPAHGQSETEPWLSPAFAIGSINGTKENPDTLYIKGSTTVYQEPCYIYNKYINIVGIDNNGESATFGNKWLVSYNDLFTTYSPALDTRTAPMIIKNIRVTNLFVYTGECAPFIFEGTKSSATPSVILDGVIVDSAIAYAGAATEIKGAVMFWSISALSLEMKNCAFSSLNNYAVNNPGTPIGLGVFSLYGSASCLSETYTFNNVTARNVSQFFTYFSVYPRNAYEDTATIVISNSIIDSCPYILQQNRTSNTVNLYLNNCDFIRYTDTYIRAINGNTVLSVSENISVDPLFIDALDSPLARYCRIPSNSPCATASTSDGYIGYWNPGGTQEPASSPVFNRANFTTRWREVLWRMR